MITVICLFGFLNASVSACETEEDKLKALKLLLQDEEFMAFACPTVLCIPANLIANDKIDFKIEKVSKPPYKVCIVLPTFSVKSGYTGTFFLQNSNWVLQQIEFNSGGGPLVIDSDPVRLRYKLVTDYNSQEAYVDVYEWHENIFRLVKSVHFDPAPSFDCENYLPDAEKTISSVEKTICNDETLSRLDSALSSNFKVVLSHNGKEKNRRLRSAQSAWLQQRNACNTVECLAESYSQRIDQLCTNYLPVSDRIFSCISAIEAKTF
jgi:uncharacterized protein YecT (DUF1311 family)